MYLLYGFRYTSQRYGVTTMVRVTGKQENTRGNSGRLVRLVQLK